MGKFIEQFINHRGKNKAVIMPIKDYQRLLEDLHDLTVIAECVDQPLSVLRS